MKILERIKKYKINFQTITNIVVIFSVLFAVYTYQHTIWEACNKEKTEYINQLESLKRELEVNLVAKIPYFNKNKEIYLEGGAIPSYRFYTGNINNLLENGIIKNYSLRDKLYNIADRENEVNRLLDSSMLTFHTSNLTDKETSQDRVTLRVQLNNEIIMNNVAEITEKITKILELIEQHIEDIKDDDC